MPIGVYVRSNEYKLKIKKTMQKLAQDPEWIRKQTDVNRKLSKDPEWIRKNKEARQNPEWIRKNKEAAERRSKDPEWIRKNKEANRTKYNDPEFIIRVVEGMYGGFWYGNVNYNCYKKYCEKWNKDLWNRIDMFQNYKSILSGKTKKENNNQNLSHHHVYWQEKACCEWDEDSQGYYAIINVGTNKNPIMYKYYIDGDPNKFVLLTCSEHAMVAKDKLKWIKILENLIKIKYNNKCYYTKEEYENLIL